MTGVGVEARPLWRDRRFATYWTGQTISQFGDRISELALPLIAVGTLAASPTQVGLLTAAVWAPNVVSLFVGSWVDQQQHKRRLLIAADLGRAAVLLSLPIAHVLGVVTLAQLFVVALLSGLGQVLFQTSNQPFFVALVRRDQYIEANSLLSTTRSASFIAGPAVGGGLIQAVTAPVAMLVDALSFVASALLLRRVPVTERPVVAAEAESLLRRAWDGMRFVVRDPYLRASLGCATTVNFFNFMASALLILFASRELGLPAGVIGLAFGLGGIGGIVGALVATRLSRAIGVGRAIVLGGIVFSAPIAVIPLAQGPTWAKAGVLVLAEFVSAAGVMWFDINANALKASVIPDELRSRVTGAFATVNYGIRPLGAVAGGVLAEVIGTGATLVVAAVGGSLAVLWLLPSPIPGVRTVDELEPIAR